MNARTIASLAVVSLAVIALALGAVLVLRESAAKDGTPSKADAPTCDLSQLPLSQFPALDASPVLLWPDGSARLTFDGAAELSTPDAPLSFLPGEHQLRVECGERHADQTVTFEPFRPAAVFADCSAGPHLTVFGVEGDEKVARVKALKGPKNSGLRELVEALGALERREDARLTALFVNRWNGVTDRYARVRAVIGREAPGASDSANTRFEELSRGFMLANEAHDTPTLDGSVRAAEETLRVLVRAARLSRPHDCEFQTRLTQSF